MWERKGLLEECKKRIKGTKWKNERKERRGEIWNKDKGTVGRRSLGFRKELACSTMYLCINIVDPNELCLVGPLWNDDIAGWTIFPPEKESATP